MNLGQRLTYRGILWVSFAINVVEMLICLLTFTAYYNTRFSVWVLINASVYKARSEAKAFGRKPPEWIPL